MRGTPREAGALGSNTAHPTPPASVERATAASGLGYDRITLRDGRALAFVEYGRPDGRPVIYCHGAPSSRLEPQGDAAVAAELGLRIIAPDRPGLGRSDFHPGRRVADWPNDVLQLAAALDLDQFAIMGASAGGPYALACASQMPDRVRAVGLIASVAPTAAPGVDAGMSGGTRTFWWMARYLPFALETFFSVLVPDDKEQGDAWLDNVAGALPEHDRALFRDVEFRRTFGAMFKEAFAQGPRGAVADIACVARPWEIDLAAIKVPTLLWQGKRDKLLVAAHYLAGAIPGCRATYYPDDGHLTLAANHRREILGAMADTLTG